MHHNIKQILLILAAVLNTTPAYCGGKVGKIAGGIALGVVTGGASFAITEAVGAAVATGTATAAAVATGGRVPARAGITLNGETGNVRTVNVGVGRRPDGSDLLHAEFAARGTSTEGTYHGCSYERDYLEDAYQESLIAQASFSNWAPNATYGIKYVNGVEYHMAKTSSREFLSLGVGRDWFQTTREWIGYSSFVNQPWNLEFEKTPLEWHFDIQIIDGCRYNHAWTDSMLDFLVPEGECHRICAPQWYVDQYNAEQELKKNGGNVLAQERLEKTHEDATKELAKGYVEEAIWSTFNTSRAINMDDEYAARRSAEHAISYVEMAQDTLRYVGYFISDTLNEFATPGGVENLRRYQRGEISAYEYNAIVSNDIATDGLASSIGALIGGTAGGASGFATGPAAAAAVPAGISLGAAKGATVGYVASRAAKAIARATVSAFKGKSGDSQRVVREYGKGRYWDKLIENKDSAVRAGLNGKQADRISGTINEAKRKFGGDIRADSNGNLYKFDNSHVSAKVHLEQIVKRSDDFHGTGEVDPETGLIIRTFDRFLGK